MYIYIYVYVYIYICVCVLYVYMYTYQYVYGYLFEWMQYQKGGTGFCAPQLFDISKRCISGFADEARPSLLQCRCGCSCPKPRPFGRWGSDGFCSTWQAGCLHDIPWSSITRLAVAAQFTEDVPKAPWQQDWRMTFTDCLTVVENDIIQRAIVWCNLRIGVITAFIICFCKLTWDIWDQLVSGLDGLLAEFAVLCGQTRQGTDPEFGLLDEVPGEWVHLHSSFHNISDSVWTNHMKSYEIDILVSPY